jgi:hypothetical protein
MIRYKVVTKIRRQSTNTYVCYGTSDDKCSKYALRYLKGKIVNALPNTMGIMVFKDRRCAAQFLLFLQGNIGNEDQLKIVRVRPIGKKSIPKRIARCCSDSGIDNWYNRQRIPLALEDVFKDMSLEAAPNVDAPYGTECYEAVEVLE